MTLFITRPILLKLLLTSHDKFRIRRHIHRLCIATLLLGSIATSRGVPKPNIVLILADDVGCEPIGCYGGESFATPNIDALAKNGMKFEHCYSMPVCHPSRIALMTGRYPFRFKAGWGSFPKNEEKRSIGQVMKEAGYATAVAGKWQMTLLKKDLEQPYRMGFDQWSVFGWHEGARFHNPMIYQNGKVREGLKGEYGPELYVKFLSDFMKRSQKEGKPFFAYYSMASGPRRHRRPEVASSLCTRQGSLDELRGNDCLDG